MSKLKSLASQTAVYGVSSILGRMLTYALVPLHTAVFPREEMGIVTYLYGFVAMFLVVYTFGMETTFFRFANKDNPQSTLNQTATFVITISSLITIGLLFGAGYIADSDADLTGAGTFIRWLALTLWIDAILAIPFALMRFENKARAFATAKLINIFLTVGLQLFFLVGVPWLRKQGVHWFDFLPDLGIGYIFLTNLVSNLVLLIILRKWVLRIKLTRLTWVNFKPLLWYATPIMITGLAGMTNEQLDKILLKEMLPQDFYGETSPVEALGVYGQLFKLSIFMMLGIQAFRYAGEPFFFSQANDKQAPELFARVMHYFVIACLLVLVLVTINVDLIAWIFLRQPEYRVAFYIVPILLTGKLFYGIYTNLSIWFKLTDKTQYGTYFSILGALITVIGNMALIPVIGFEASAWTSVACYFSMVVVCYFYGQKYYPIPYKFGPLFGYFIISILLVLISLKFHYENFWLDTAFRIGVSMLITGLLFFRERGKLRKSGVPV